VGAVTQVGIRFAARAVVLTAGTFLDGRIHIGLENHSAGRAGDPPAVRLSARLKELRLPQGRLKTGTPPRLDGRTIDFSRCTMQPGDGMPGPSGEPASTPMPVFSFLGTPDQHPPQLPCWITHTHEGTHAIIRSGFERSPMFTGVIEGVGPRYCPSIEDKINRFADRERHQLFVEPEGWNTVEIYLNGFSTSLPEDVQYQALIKIPGFENVRMFRPGYAIEYDYFPPHQLHYSLETKHLGGLFFAGQINGTTGYEEAACQGLMAGINAPNQAHGKAPLILKRSEAYIGVLIDDLITKGTEEPYRMFTSRAEFRTLLRQDNADLRLTGIGYELGLASAERFQNMMNKSQHVAEIIKKFNEISIDPLHMNSLFESIGSSPMQQKQKLSQLVLRPGVGAKQMIDHYPELKKEFETYSDIELEQAEIQMKYDVYIEKEKEMVERMTQMEDLEIPATFDFDRVQAIGNEAKEKLKKIQPRTLGQASRISGINPSDVQILMVYMGR